MLSKPSRTGLALVTGALLSLAFPAPSFAQKAPTKAPAKAAPAKAPTKGASPPAPAPDTAAAPPPPTTPPPATPPKPAAPGKKGAKPPEDDSNKLLEDAAKAAKANNWEEARTLLQRAYKIRPTWRVAYELGRAEIGAEKWKDAADHLTIALRDKPDDLPEAERKAIETAFAQAKAQVGTLRVNVAQKGAEVFIGGVSVGTSPLPGPVYVEPGTVLVEAKLEGYFGLRAQKALTAGAEETVDFSLHRDGGAGVAPPPPPSGERLFKGTNLIVLISGASLAGVATVLGGVFAIMSNGKASQSHELEQPNAACAPITDCMAQFDALQKQKVTFAGASMWSFIGAGAVLVGTGTYLTIQLLTKPNTNVKSSFVLAPNFAGATFDVKF